MRSQSTSGSAGGSQGQQPGYFMSWFRGRKQAENNLSSEQASVLQGHQRQLKSLAMELD